MRTDTSLRTQDSSHAAVSLMVAVVVTILLSLIVW
jgi:hypothetical protein